MNVVVQHLTSKLYLAANGKWVKLDGRPATFPHALDAISFCIKRRIRTVRLVNDAGQDGSERYFYPFGEDPAIKAERKKLRRALSHSRRLKQRQRDLRASLEIINDGQKERRKEVPFIKRKPVDGASSAVNSEAL